MAKKLKKRKAFPVWVLILLLVVAVVLAIVLIPKKIASNTIAKIAVSKAPDTTTFVVGQEADFTGIWLDVIMEDGSFVTIKDPSQMIFSGFDSSKVTDKMIVGVNYEGFTTTFTLKVEEAPKPKPKLLSIRLDPKPLVHEYTIAEALDVTGGMIVREYNDEELRPPINLKPIDVTGFKAAKEDFKAAMENDPDLERRTYTLTVTYEGKTAYYDIDFVKEKK